jgi:glycosyltransferase involved in cell wall biosynthesis
MLSPEKAERLTQKYQLNKPYILFVGTREPRKNLERLIQAWQPLADSVELVIAGASGWDELNIPGKQPRILGAVSDELLCVLYKNAQLLAYPSLDEGFGLPILEAFYYNTPVLTSNRSAMKEVAGNAAELIDPESVESINKGLTNILNENPTEQKARVQRMTIRLHMFNWAETAKQTMEVYQVAAS